MGACQSSAPKIVLPVSIGTRAEKRLGVSKEHVTNEVRHPINGEHRLPSKQRKEFEFSDIAEELSIRKKEQEYTLLTKMGKLKVPHLLEPAQASSIMRRRADRPAFSAASSEKSLELKTIGARGNESATTARAFSSFKGELSTPLQSL